MKEERVTITIQSGERKLFALLHLPEEAREEAVPAVLVCHGLGGTKVGKYRFYVDLAYRLACRGIAALRFDYSGCGDSEGFFSDITPSQHVQDTLRAFKTLAKHPGIDAGRIGVIGRSYGGAIAIKAAPLFGHVKSLVLIAPLFSGAPWRERWEAAKSSSLDEKEKEALLQIEGQRAGVHFFEEFFSIELASDLSELSSVPLLHICGEIDKLVDLQHREGFVESRKGCTSSSSFITFPKSDHNFSFIPERESAMQEAVDWFIDTLL